MLGTETTIGHSVVSVVLWRGNGRAVSGDIEDGESESALSGQVFFSGFWWCQSFGEAEWD